MNRRALLSTAVLLVVPLASSAQKLSEAASVMQEVAGVRLVVEYSRPVARGRAELFGGVVKWGEVWTPGANDATTFETSARIVMNGLSVPKGKYSIWMIPADTGAWTVFLNRIARRWHTNRPRDSREDVVRFAVLPVTAPHVEVLTFSFPAVRKDGVVLQMQWGQTAVPIEIGLPPRDSSSYSIRSNTPASRFLRTLSAVK